MEHDISTQEIRQRAARALIPMDALFKRAGIRASTFYRWEKDLTKPSLLSIEKIRQALEAFEAEKSE